MTWKSSLALIFAFAIASSIFGGTLLQDKSKVPELRKDGLLPPIARQLSYQRHWLENKAIRVLTIDVASHVQSASKVVVDAMDNFYLLDFDSGNVKKLSSRGKLLAVYGRGKGREPGHFLAPTDFFVDDQRRVWVADAGNGRVEVFAPEGTLLQSLAQERPVYRLTGGRNGQLFAMHIPTGGSLFSLLTPESEHHSQRLSLDSLLEVQNREALVLDGFIAGGGKSFVYAPIRFGALLKLDRDGRPSFFRETIDREPMPKVFTAKDGTLSVDREAPIAALSLSVAGNEVFVLNSIEDGFRRRKIFDVYSYEDGGYQYSFNLPSESTMGWISSRRLVTQNGTSLSLWNLN